MKAPLDWCTQAEKKNLKCFDERNFLSLGDVLTQGVEVGQITAYGPQMMSTELNMYRTLNIS